MIAFVLYGYHSAVRPNVMPTVIPCSHRSPWVGQGRISYRTSQFSGRSFIPRTTCPRREGQDTFSTPRAMFSGGGGILGVGPSEVVVILAVGWLLLGPEKLFSLAKDSGRLLGELRRTADEARTSLNDAMELDSIAAEFEKSKTLAQENGTSDADSDDEVGDEIDELSSKSEESENGVQPGEDAVEPMAGNIFLDQLERVADPNQKPPEEVPNLDSYSDEELEVQRLEQQYFEARERLENRRRQRMDNTTSESEPVVEER